MLCVYVRAQMQTYSVHAVCTVCRHHGSVDPSRVGVAAGRHQWIRVGALGRRPASGLRYRLHRSLAERRRIDDRTAGVPQGSQHRAGCGSVERVDAEVSG